MALVDRISEELVEWFSPPDGEIADPIDTMRRAVDASVASAIGRCAPPNDSGT